MKLWSTTNLEELRSWLNKRTASMQRERTPHEAGWRMLAEHYEPDLGRALNDQADVEAEQAAARDKKILNSTPRIELRRMAAALKSGTANESRQWFRLRVAGESEQRENPAWAIWLDEVTRRMSELLDRSNAYGAIGQLFLATGLFGHGAAIISGEHPYDTLHIRTIDNGAYWLASTRQGRVDVLLRRVSMTAREIWEEFGEKRAPDKVKGEIEAGREEQRFLLWNLVTPHDTERFADLDASMSHASVWWSTESRDCGGEDTAGVIDIRGYGYNPILCPRWDVVDGVYATGPGRIGMPDVLMLYRLEKDSLKAIAQAVDPPLAAPESMEGRGINTYPGGVTYYPEVMGTKDRSLHNLIEQMPDVQKVELKIQQVEARIRRVFYADLFNAILNVANSSATQMTARQVDEMSGEKIALLGPVLTNLNHGLFDPLVDAVFAIMAEKGLLPEPPMGMAGQEISVQYISALHMRQQEEARLGGIMRFSQFAAGLLQMAPEALDKIDADQMLDEAAQALAVPGGCVRSDAKVEQIRQARAQAQQEAQRALAMAEMGRQVPGYAEAAEKLQRTPVGPANALEAVLGATEATTGGIL